MKEHLDPLEIIVVLASATAVMVVAIFDIQDS